MTTPQSMAVRVVFMLTWLRHEYYPRADQSHVKNIAATVITVQLTLAR
jgi:hypothetical protein